MGISVTLINRVKNILKIVPIVILIFINLKSWIELSGSNLSFVWHQYIGVILLYISIFLFFLNKNLFLVVSFFLFMLLLFGAVSLSVFQYYNRYSFQINGNEIEIIIRETYLYIFLFHFVVNFKGYKDLLLNKMKS